MPARPYLIEALGCTGDWRTAVRLRPFLHSQNALDRGTAVAAIAQLKPALEKASGQRRHKTTVSRILKRQQWRKVVPRPRHPQASAEEQEAFKKTSLSK